jgi:hypothetical protein
MIKKKSSQKKYKEKIEPLLGSLHTFLSIRLGEMGVSPNLSVRYVKGMKARLGEVEEELLLFMNENSSFEIEDSDSWDEMRDVVSSIKKINGVIDDSMVDPEISSDPEIPIHIRNRRKLVKKDKAKNVVDSITLELEE